MSWFHKTLLGSLLITMLAACGFSPLHGNGGAEDTAVKHLLARTEIEIIPNREGVSLRNNLIDRFYIYGQPQTPVYRLRITPLRQTLTDLDITKTSDATRGQLRLNTSVTLIRTADNSEVLNRDIVAITSYNILASEFANRVSEQSAREDAINDLARQIETCVSLYFDRIK